ncbi:MAG: hypothetical protein JWP00_536 [Chloroflexi bacterium]|jgi:hypothetical protein|nr:hypothetical protein [Chloroflexota bacterium]
MTFSRNHEQVYFLWECPTCRIANQSDLIFCPNCAFNEGLAEPTPDRPERTSKITEALGSAIEWSLKHGQLKPAEIVAQAARKHPGIHSLEDLRRLPVADLSRLADSFLNFSRLGATGSGLTAGLPGGLAAFATIPADISALVYFSLRCIGGISQSYSLEIASETGQTIQLLAFAYAARVETLVIGQRRLENAQLAAFLLQNPEHTRLVKACLLKQLSAHLTVDFAKTSWATFLPVVGGVVNGMDHFWFLGEVGKRSKQFYRALLPGLPGFTPALPAGPVTLDVLEEKVELAGKLYDLYLVKPFNRVKLAFVVVIGEKPVAERWAEKLALAGIGALALDLSAGKEGLKTVWSYLLRTYPESYSPPGPGLLGLGEGAGLSLEALPLLDPPPGAVVLYDLAPLDKPVKVAVPLLLQMGAAAYVPAEGWLSNLTAAGERGLIAINTFDDQGDGPTGTGSPDYTAPAPGWVWLDTLDWLNRPV